MREITKIFEHLLHAINDIIKIWYMEFTRCFKDTGVMIFLVLVPIGYPLIYSYIYTQEVVREIPTAVCDLSNTAMSRKFIRMVNATPDVEVSAYCTDMKEAQRLMEKKETFGIVYIPRDFSDNIISGKQANISIYCDMTSMLYYKALLVACTDVSLEMGRDIKISKLGNSTKRQDEISTKPLEYTSVSISNPTNGFANFIIPAILILIIQQTLLLGVGLSIGTDREKDGFSQFRHFTKRRFGTLHIVAGKSLAYFTIYAPVAAYMLCLVPTFFNLTQLSNGLTLSIFILPYLLSCIFFAMTCGILAINRETPILLFVFTSIPILFLSGVSWPGSAVPPFWKIFSYIFPSTFAINGFIRINDMGATIEDVSYEYKTLWIQTALYCTTACTVYYYLMHKNRKTGE